MNFDLAPHIYTLLFQQETVIFPNFGGLVSSYNPASVDFVQGIIYPPSKIISLNVRLTSNDGVLEQFVRNQFSLTGEEACQVIDTFIKEMDEALDKGEIVLFPKVGRLYKNYERKLQFLQENTNFNKDAYGLPPVHFYPILRSYEGEKISDAAKPVAHPKMVGKPKSVSKRLQAVMPILVSCAVVSIAISLYFLTPLPTGEGEANPNFRVTVSENRINQKPETETAMIGGAALSDRSLRSSEDDVIISESTPFIKEEIVETESASLAPSTKECVIIIGAFRQKEGVRVTVEKIYTLGYDAYQDKKNGLTRVGIQLAYEDQMDINRALSLVRNNINMKAWILKK